VGPAGLRNPSRPPTHTPAPSRKSPLPPRAGTRRRSPFVTLPIARTASIPMPLALGWVHIDHHAPRLATIQPRDLTHASLHPARPGPSGERIGASRGSAPQPTGAGTLSERPAGREFGPALAERDEGSPASAGPMPLSAARMDTDGPLSAAAGRPPARSSNGSDGRPPGPRRHRRKAPRRA